MSKPSCFVATIDLSLADRLKSDLIEQGFRLSHPEHTLFLAQKEGIICTLYASGKLTVQGKNKEEFITFYLEPEILKKLDYSYPHLHINFARHIGVDEAGKGDYFGPLCIAAVEAEGETIQKLLDLGVKDSKRMSENSIIKIAEELRAHFAHSVVAIFPSKYNTLYTKFRNLNRLLAWAHATAIQNLAQKTGCTEALIDQFTDKNLVGEALASKQLQVHLTQRPRAEDDPVVAAASILARYSFVKGLEKLGEEISFTLPKGASSAVIAAGKEVVKRHGKEILAQIAKLHFKTTDMVLDQ